ILILDTWGRAIHTLFFMPAAALGWSGYRWAALLASAGTVAITYLIGKRLQIAFAWAIPLLLWFQPWFVVTSFTGITEVTFSLALLAAIYCALRKSDLMAGLLFGMLPLIRTEGAGLSVLFFVYCAFRREWKAMALIAGPVVLYNVAGLLGMGMLPAHVYMNARPISQEQLDMMKFPTGSWGLYPKTLVAYAGPPLMVLMLYGLPMVFRSVARVLVAIPFTAYFAAHVVIAKFSLFGTGGDWRYILPAAPAVAIVAAMGLGLLVAQVRDGVQSWLPQLPKPMITVPILFMCLGVVTLYGIRGSDPLQEDPEQRPAREVAAWLRDAGLASQNLVSTHPWIYYYLPRQVPDMLWSRHPLPAAFPAGTILLWDTHYSEIFGWRREELEASAEWELVHADSRPLPMNPNARFEFLVFRKRASDERSLN
ncbi:MAG: hypothetical protein AB7O65_13530, partial [Candidatus Korobacteraceae bacterium]